MKALCIGNGPSSDRIPWRDMTGEYDLVVGVNFRVRKPAGLTHWVSIHKKVEYLPHWGELTRRNIKVYVGAPEWGPAPPFPAVPFEDLRPGRHPFPARGDTARLMCMGVMMPALHLAWQLGADELHITGMDDEPGYAEGCGNPPGVKPRRVGVQYADGGEPEAWRNFFLHLSARGASFKALTPSPVSAFFPA